MIVGKSYEQILEDMRRRVEAVLPGVSWSAGSVARALLSAAAEEIADAYAAVDFAVQMCSLSTSRGIFLDMVFGKMLGIPRLEGESDEAYRARIAESEFVRAGKNEAALRVACLSAPYVRDVVIRKWSYGPGSYAVYVVPQDREHYAEAIAAVEEVVARETAAGVSAAVMRPLEVQVDLHVALSFKQGTTSAARADAARKVEEALVSYIENLEPGGRLVDTDVIKIGRSQSSEVVDLEVLYFAVGGRPAAFADCQLEWDERFVPGQIVVQ